MSELIHGVDGWVVATLHAKKRGMKRVRKSERRSTVGWDVRRSEGMEGRYVRPR